VSTHGFLRLGLEMTQGHICQILLASPDSREKKSTPALDGRNCKVLEKGTERVEDFGYFCDLPSYSIFI